MIDLERFQRQSDDLSKSLKSKLGLSMRNFERQLKQATRHLPRKSRQDCKTILQAARHQHHPKLARLVETDRVDQAFSNLKTQVKRIDVADRRRGAILGAAGAMVLNLLILGLGVILVLIWQGLL